MALLRRSTSFNLAIRPVGGAASRVGMPQGIDYIYIPGSGPADLTIPEYKARDRQTPNDVETGETATKNTTFHRKGHFDFLSLPPELRNVIYRLLVISHSPLHPYSENPLTNPATPSPPARKDLAIFLVNQQLSTEASRTFYASNVFTFSLDLTGRPRPQPRGFHPNLHRMRKCLLWRTQPNYSIYSSIAASQEKASNIYARLLMESFTRTLSQKTQLQYLILDTAYATATMLEPLGALRGLKQVHIEYRRGPDGLCPLYVRNLERVMKSNMPKRSAAMGHVLDMGEEAVRAGGEDEKEVGEMRRMKEVCGFGVEEGEMGEFEWR